MNNKSNAQCLIPNASQTIGLLGGSFNPAHAGHIHLSQQAIKRLRLDAVWWLVSPHNPLKAKSDLAKYETRIAHARDLTANHRNITVSDFEAQHNFHYSIDTITALQKTYPRMRFIWLMGADNLASFHKWRNWEAMFKSIPIAVFDRSPYQLSALSSKAAQRFRNNRLDERDGMKLASEDAPSWAYFTMPRHPQSATNLRKKLGNKAFLGHTK